jgi:hypothetical protein
VIRMILPHGESLSSGFQTTHRNPFRIAANTPVLHKAFDQLVGAGRWVSRKSLGSFPIRFPSPADPGDTGWHIDVSFGSDNPFLGCSKPTSVGGFERGFL